MTTVPHCNSHNLPELQFIVFPIPRQVVLLSVSAVVVHVDVMKQKREVSMLNGRQHCIYMGL